MNSIVTSTSRRPDVAFFRSGRIDISARVAKILDLKQGDAIDIAREDDEYFLYVAHRAPLFGKFRGQCIRTNKRGGHFRTYSRDLSRAVFAITKSDSLRQKENISVGETISKYGKDYLTLILRRHD